MSLFDLFIDLDLYLNRDVVIWGIDDEKEALEELYEGPVSEIPFWILICPFIAMFISEEDPDVLHFSVEFELPDDKE